MRTLLALLLCLAACGAESPTPSTGDASTATDGASDAPRLRCPFDQAFVGGRCVAATARDCAGSRCSASQNCYVSLGSNGEDDVAECL